MGIINWMKKVTKKWVFYLFLKDVEKVVKRGGGGLVGSFEPTTPNHINTDNATTSYYPNTNRLDGLEDYIKPPKPPVGIVQGLTRIILENNSTVRCK